MAGWGGAGGGGVGGGVVEWGYKRKTVLQEKGEDSLWENKAPPLPHPHPLHTQFSVLGASPEPGVFLPENPWKSGYSLYGHVPAPSWWTGAPHPTAHPTLPSPLPGVSQETSLAFRVNNP